MSSVVRNSRASSGGCKRSRPEGVIVGVDGSQGKRRKMDRSVTQQCSSLLKALMKHPASGRIFSQPLDPKALKKNPMDLNKIKFKLEKNTYLGIEEFAADIKLMFSNAMLCNPLSNNVHNMDEQVNDFFEARLKSLGENWNHQENLKIGIRKILSSLKVVNGTRKSCPKTQPSRNSSNLPKKSKPSEKKVVKMPLNARAADICVRLTSQMSKSDVPHSDGTVSALNDENIVIVPATNAASGERLLTPIIDVQMSPKKALRAAMLKSGFADTILNAQLKINTILLDHGNKADGPVKMQQEKLEVRQREVKARIRAAEAAAKMKAEAELKRQREREREAARIALQKMENTAGIELNLEILKELEILSGCSLYCGNPLHQLGLFIKHEYLEDEMEEAVLYEDVEEGEIVS